MSKDATRNSWYPKVDSSSKDSLSPYALIKKQGLGVKLNPMGRSSLGFKHAGESSVKDIKLPYKGKLKALSKSTYIKTDFAHERRKLELQQGLKQKYSEYQHMLQQKEVKSFNLAKSNLMYKFEEYKQLKNMQLPSHRSTEMTHVWERRTNAQQS